MRAMMSLAFCFNSSCFTRVACIVDDDQEEKMQVVGQAMCDLCAAAHLTPRTTLACHRLWQLIRQQSPAGQTALTKGLG